MRLLRLLRRAALTTLALLLVLFTTVQFQQHLLRHRAERLHAEILALQLHPGTFADLQRLQKEWGAHAYYDGECTPHHCAYEITLPDSIDHLLVWRERLAWLTTPYYLLGGRYVSAGALLCVDDDRVWRENFFVIASVLPYQDTRIFHDQSPQLNGTRRHEAFTLFATISGMQRLFEPGDVIYAAALQTGYRIGFEGFCTGCVGANIYLTPQTKPDEIRWLNKINFDCLTRYLPCLTEDDLLPIAWPRRHSYEHREPGNDDPFDKPNLRLASAEDLGREAPEAILVEVIASSITHPDGRYTGAHVRVVARLKAARDLPPGTLTNLAFDPMLWAGSLSEADTAPGQHIIIGFYYVRASQMGPRHPEVKFILKDTPENRQAFLSGAKTDLSGPYEDAY